MFDTHNNVKSHQKKPIYILMGAVALLLLAAFFIVYYFLFGR